MIRPKLMNCVPGALAFHRGGLKILLGLTATLGTVAIAGCINLEAPEEPIVIELNINITQEVIYRLAEDAGTTIEENAEIF